MIELIAATAGERALLRNSSRLAGKDARVGSMVSRSLCDALFELVGR